MCGIVGAIAKRDITSVLLTGLKALEYRGYDSAGLAVLDENNHLQRLRTLGKVRELENALSKNTVRGNIGIAHTRWATHGAPNESNAHPQLSNDSIAVVHNGIIENHDLLRAQLKKDGYLFSSETDTEVVAHLFHQQEASGSDLLTAAISIAKKLEGAFALVICSTHDPKRLIAIRRGAPLVIGLGQGENFIASDPLALATETHEFIYLHENDIAEVHLDQVAIYDQNGEPVSRAIQHVNHVQDVADKGSFRHFMAKEIFSQAEAISSTLEGRLSNKSIFEAAFGNQAPGIFDRIERIQIVACGTSYHAGMVARYWLESFAGIPCRVEVASEFRYRKSVVEPNTLLITISQSGETADTLAALRASKNMGFIASLAICNVAHSSLVRESDLTLLTRAGIEIGVASTKAFTTQLVALLLFSAVVGRKKQTSTAPEIDLIAQLNHLPQLVNQTLQLDAEIAKLSQRFVNKKHALFLGRGVHYPIALEGALKLKEISYIHAEAYPAGELKHGPLALVDADMPVIAVAPNDELLEKLKSNLQEVRARGGELFVFADHNIDFPSTEGVTIMPMPTVGKLISPIVYTIPLQLLAYHVAVMKGTDIDQPRNLAKSVTVE